MNGIKVNPNLISLLEKKVKYLYETFYKKEYCGLFSVAEWLLNYYYTVFYPYRESEFEYLSALKMNIIHFQVAQVLASNKDFYFKHKKVDIEKLFEEADKEIIDIKKQIYNLWRNNSLSKKLKSIEERLKLKEDYKLKLCYKMLRNLVVLYPEFKISEIRNFKKDIGLC